MKAVLLLLGGALVLSGCGASKGLLPAKGESLPIAPYGAKAPPDAKLLLTPKNQALPGRSDELLTDSENRRSDEFDLPPPN